MNAPIALHTVALTSADRRIPPGETAPTALPYRRRSPETVHAVGTPSKSMRYKRQQRARGGGWWGGSDREAFPHFACMHACLMVGSSGRQAYSNFAYINA